MKAWLRRWVAFSGAWLLLSSAALAQQGAPPGDDSKARAHFELGHAHYADGEFQDAAEQFEKAYSLSPMPVLLYNAYLAYRDANEPQKAADTLERYLEADPDAPNREKLQAALEALREGPEGEPPPSEGQPRRPGAAEDSEKGEKRRMSVTTEVLSPEEPSLHAEDSGSSDEPPPGFGAWPYVTMAGGGALLAGALVTGLLREDAKSDLESVCEEGVCPPGLESTQERGRRLSVITDVLWIGGLVTAGTGLVLWIIDHTRSEDPARSSARPRADLGCSTRACAATLEVPF